jgi:endonuclease YncB( thermonuclease family)
MIWSVPGTVQRVIDADTIVMRLDLGWRVSREAEPVRIFGVNAPELSTLEGKLARSFAESLLPIGLAVTVVSLKLLGSFDKYGRTLASLVLPDGSDYGQHLIDSGNAVAYYV